ncbi:Homeodomain-like protein [Hypoxylon sp. FL1284]|nr:Homeodomain-like protein [Hypoxylon sp. FL1284]
MPSTAEQRRGPWSRSEDDRLRQLVDLRGPTNWVAIANELGTRSAKQCRERYHQNLKQSLDHTPIRPDEGDLINTMVNQIGRRWAEIARRLDNRCDNTVKNWWNGGQNRRIRKDRRRASRQSGRHDEAHEGLTIQAARGTAAFPEHGCTAPAVYNLTTPLRPQLSPCQSLSTASVQYVSPVPPVPRPGASIPIDGLTKFSRRRISRPGTGLFVEIIGCIALWGQPYSPFDSWLTQLRVG